MDASPYQTAAQVLEVVPLVMRVLREQMRSHRTADLSVPEFRTLGFLSRHPGASLSDVADHIGLTLPSMSKLVDGLVERRLLTRQSNAANRRRMKLTLTARGRAILQAAREPARAYVGDVLARLSPAERATVIQAMRVLRPLFISDREKEMLLAKGNHGNS